MTIQEDIDRLKLQEQRLRFKHFNEHVAWELGTLLKSEMTARMLFHYAMANTAPDSRQASRAATRRADAGSGVNLSLIS